MELRAQAAASGCFQHLLLLLLLPEIWLPLEGLLHAPGPRPTHAARPAPAPPPPHGPRGSARLGGRRAHRLWRAAPGALSSVLCRPAPQSGQDLEQRPGLPSRSLHLPAPSARPDSRISPKTIAVNEDI